MWYDLFDKVIYWRNVIWSDFNNFFVLKTSIWGLCRTQKNVKLFLIFQILERDVTNFPSHFHLIYFIYKNLSHSLRHSRLIHFIDHSPSHSHLLYLIILILHSYSTSLALSLFNQSCLWKLGVSLDKFLIWNAYCITGANTGKLSQCKALLGIVISIPKFKSSEVHVVT